MEQTKLETWTRAGVLLLALMNQIITILGKNPIPVSEEDAYITVSTIVTIVAAMWGFWKNNSFTASAIAADIYLEELREGETLDN